MAKTQGRRADGTSGWGSTRRTGKCQKSVPSRSIENWSFGESRERERERENEPTPGNEHLLAASWNESTSGGMGGLTFSRKLSSSYSS